jgi:hypothetical protein
VGLRSLCQSDDSCTHNATNVASPQGVESLNDEVRLRLMQ